ncbi:hypothetical protein ACFUOZ_15120 [Paenarthrobacter sp. NPDC057355]|uniref:hypothetical protein n=1 Tax=unclassified Paenarthrobacter TaxID=2634190 RepID=UPI0021CA5810|nr:hypothetical protein [Paenarthrobacter sp. JL.01a]UXM91101.1 hypothetical protein N5P29_17660 [Paenarthrobacter sp. JL.01a]
MKKFALQSVGISALVVMALTGCGGSTGSTNSASPEATASPTPTAAKQYTNDELVELVKQIKPKSGKELTVASSEELAQENPIKALMSMFTIEPAECKDLATLGGTETLAGSTTAAGADLDAASGVMTMVTLTSGLEKQKLQDSIDKSGAEVEKCSKMTLSMSGQSMNVSTEKFDGINAVPGTVAYKTEMSTASGSAQTTYMAYAIKDGVLISATASGKGAEANGVATANDLMQQAAALVK